MITVSFAPLLVMLRKGLQRLAAYTVHMPVGVDKIYPFLVAIASCGAVKEIVGTRIGQVKQGDKVVLHCGFLGHIEAKLPVHGF